MRRHMCLYVLAGAMLMGCMTSPAESDSEPSNPGRHAFDDGSSPMNGNPDSLPNGDNPRAEDGDVPIPPQAGNRPGGGGGATPVDGEVSPLFEGVCYAQFKADYAHVAVDQNSKFSAEANEKLIVASIETDIELVRLSLVYLIEQRQTDDPSQTEMDHASGEDIDGVSGGDFPDDESDDNGAGGGEIGVQVVELNPLLVTEVTLTAATFDELPVTIDCAWESAPKGTASFEPISLYADEALTQFVCELGPYVVLPSPSQIDAIGHDAGDESAVFRVFNESLVDVCEGLTSLHFKVAGHIVDGERKYYPPIKTILRQPDVPIESDN